MNREKRKGFGIEGERDNGRVTGKGGGMREVEALRVNEVMRGRERVKTRVSATKKLDFCDSGFVALCHFCEDRQCQKF